MPDHFNAAATADAPALTAELLQRVALNADGAQFDDNDPETWAEADAAEPELIRRGPVRFRIVDPDGNELGVATGAVEQGGPAATCLLVEFDTAADALQPVMGQYVVLEADEGVHVVFVVWTTYADLNDPASPDLGPAAIRNEALASVADCPGRGLLVQVFDAGDGDDSEGEGEG